MKGNPTNLRHCTVPGCRGAYDAVGLCRRHYLRQYRGLPLDGKPAASTTPRSGPSYCRGGKAV